MLTKKTSKNQITLPKKIAAQFPDTDYFRVRVAQRNIVLEPIDLDPLAAVQRKLKELGIAEVEVGRAVAWARRPRR